MKKLQLTLLLATSLTVSQSALAFKADMSSALTKAEVKFFLDAGTAPKAILAKALSEGVTLEDALSALISNGIDPSVLLAPTASGSTVETTNNTFSANTFSVTTFNSSRSSSIGGGGRSSVSRN